MLRGIPDIIGSDLLKALADTGHGDLIAIVDHFYPPITKAPNAVSIQAKGCGVAQMLDAILKMCIRDRFRNMSKVRPSRRSISPAWTSSSSVNPSSISRWPTCAEGGAAPMPKRRITASDSPRCCR